YLMVEKRDEGMAAYDLALELDRPPTRVSMYVHQQKGLVYAGTKELDRSVAEFKKAIAVQEDDFSWRNLGVSYAAQERWREAVDAFGHSLALNPEQPRVKAWLEDCKKRSGGAPPPKAAPEAKPEPKKPPGEGDASFELPSAGS